MSSKRPFPSGFCSRFWGGFAARRDRTKSDAQSILSLARSSPGVIIIPLLLFCILTTLGVWLVCFAAARDAEHQQDQARSVARHACVQYAAQLLSAISPIEAFDAIVQQDPSYRQVQEHWEMTASALLRSVPSMTVLTLAPAGVIRFVHPTQFANLGQGVDLLELAPNNSMPSILRRALTEGTSATDGPLDLGGVPGLPRHVVLVRKAIFAPASGPNDTFGQPSQAAASCGALCAYNNSTGKKFWGFVSGLVGLPPIGSVLPPGTPGYLSGSALGALSDLGYLYRLEAANGVRVAATVRQPRYPVQAPVVLPGAEWTLYVGTAGSWDPSWRAGAIAAVVVCSALAAVLLCAVLVSRRRHKALLEALLPRHVIAGLHKHNAAEKLGVPPAYTDSPAELLHGLLAALLAGEPPDLRDVVLLRSLLMQSAPWYAPVDTAARLRDANLDADVMRALMRQLGGPVDPGTPRPPGRRSEGGGGGRSGGESGVDSRFSPVAGDTKNFSPTLTTESLDPTAIAAPRDTGTGPPEPLPLPYMVDDDSRCETLRGALAAVLCPAVGPTTTTLGSNDAWRPTDTQLDQDFDSLSTVQATALHSLPALADRTLSERTLTGPNGPVSDLSSTGPSPSTSTRADAILASAPDGTSFAPHAALAVPLRPPTSAVQRIHRPPPAASRLSWVLSPNLRDASPRSSHGAQVAGVSITMCSELGGRGGSRLRIRMASCASGAASEEGQDGTAAAAAAAAGSRDAGSTVGRLDSAPNVGRHSPGRMLHRILGTAPAFLRGATAAADAKAPSQDNPLLVSASPLSLGSYGQLPSSLQQQQQEEEGRQTPGRDDLPEESQPPAKGVAAGTPTHTCRRARSASAAAIAIGATAGVERLSDAAAPGADRRSADTGRREGAAGRGVLGRAAGRAEVRPADSGSSAHRVTPAPALLDEVERLLGRVDGLRYDTWALDAATGGHALSAMGFFLLQREGLIKPFGVRPARLVRLLHALEAGYPANPYHNQVHAADVLRTLHVLLRGARLDTHYVDPLGLLAAYFAAIIHDHGHPGLTGDFLVATSHPLALRYNDRSPLESHHAASAFELLAARPDLDITEGMSREQRAAFRKQVIEMVLATDMKQHFSIVGQFTATAHRRGSAQQLQSAQGREGTTAGADVPLGAVLSHKEGAAAGGAAAAPGVVGSRKSMDKASTASVALLALSSAPVPLDEAERLLSLQVALKVADIGHLAGTMQVHQRWLGVLEEEFFRQGDQERALGLPISPLFDRAKQGVSKSQVGFFDFVALPLVRAFAEAFPGGQPLVACFEENYRHWVQVQQQQNQQQ